MRAATQPVPPSYLVLHSELIAEFRNDTHWPKHVLVHYHWRDSSLVDDVLGLYLLLGLGLACSTIGIGHAALSTNSRYVLATSVHNLAYGDGARVVEEADFSKDK